MNSSKNTESKNEKKRKNGNTRIGKENRNY